MAIIPLMRVFLRLAVLGLVLVLVALVSALTAMRIAIHGSEVSIPRFVGMTPAEAEKAAFDLGLHVLIERQYYSPQVPEGRIMSQTPDAGARVRRGWQVRVAQSLGPQRVSIPDLVGQTQRAAEINIRRRGLEVGSVAAFPVSEATPDRVVSQSPLPQASGIAAPQIDFLVSAAPEPPSFVMPSLMGQSLGAATALLRENGINVGHTRAGVPLEALLSPQAAASPSVTPGSIVIGQSPAPGQKIIAGAAVDFELRP